MQLLLANSINSMQFGRYIFCLLLLLLCCLTMHSGWMDYPLSASLPGSEITLFNGFKLPWLVLLIYFIGFSLIVFGINIGYLLLLVPVILALSFPLLDTQSLMTLLPAFFEEAKALAAIERVFYLQFPANLSIDSTYQPYFDATSPWEQLAVIYSSFTLGWYVYCAASLLLALFIIDWRCPDKLSTSILFFVLVLFSAVILSTHNYQDDFRVESATSMDSLTARQDYLQCEATLKVTPALAFSDNYLARCAALYHSHYGEAHGIYHLAAIDTVLTSDTGLLMSNLASNTRLINRLENLRLVPKISPFFAATSGYAKRKYRDIYNAHALSLIMSKDYPAALTALSAIPEAEKSSASFYLQAYARAQLGDISAVLRHFDQALRGVDNIVVIANSQCIIADSYSRAGDKVLARHYYQACNKLDNESNYWAVNGLGGG